MKLLPQNFTHRVVRYLRNEPAPVTKDVAIGGFKIGRGNPCFFIAEIGINHNGSIEIAKQLIDAAVEAKAQAVKFQKRTVTDVYTKEELEKPRAVNRTVLENAIKRGVLSDEAVTRLVGSDFKDSTNGDLKLALEFTEKEYRELFDYAKQKGILCFASPWDVKSVGFMNSLNTPCHKIASASITDMNLLQEVKNSGRPVILSTGMSTSEEVAQAVHALGNTPLVLLHTISTYPAKDEDVNLRTIIKLRQGYPTVPIGYSGHEPGIATSLAAAALGAHVIERHITLDKTMYGSDQAASLEPHELTELIKSVRIIEKAYGDGVKRVLETEIPIRDKLRKK